MIFVVLSCLVLSVSHFEKSLLNRISIVVNVIVVALWVGSAGQCRIVWSEARRCRAVLGSAGQCWEVLGSTGKYRIVLGRPGKSLAKLGYEWQCRIVLGRAGQFWAVEVRAMLSNAR